MALELWHNPVFATTIDEADAHITAFGATWSLKGTLPSFPYSCEVILR